MRREIGRVTPDRGADDDLGFALGLSLAAQATARVRSYPGAGVCFGMIVVDLPTLRRSPSGAVTALSS